MRTAIISDIHSNSAALEKVLADAKERKCDEIICLGDIVGYGYDPSGCIELCRKNCTKCILGNHDAGVIGRLSLEWFSVAAARGVMRDRKISDEDKDWLGLLEYTHRFERGGLKIAFTHGTISYPDEYAYIENRRIAAHELTAMRYEKLDLMFVGHTHEATAFSTGIEDRFIADQRKATGYFEIEKGTEYIFNVGSVGYPRVQPFSSYAILETSDEGSSMASVGFVRLPFDMDGYVKNLEKSGIAVPAWVDYWEDKFEG